MHTISLDILHIIGSAHDSKCWRRCKNDILNSCGRHPQNLTVLHIKQWIYSQLFTSLLRYTKKKWTILINSLLHSHKGNQNTLTTRQQLSGLWITSKHKQIQKDQKLVPQCNSKCIYQGILTNLQCQKTYIPTCLGKFLDALDDSCIFQCQNMVA